jgi:hypothetical protein
MMKKNCAEGLVSETMTAFYANVKYSDTKKMVYMIFKKEKEKKRKKKRKAKEKEGIYGQVSNPLTREKNGIY